jgi:internalin A
MKVLNTLQLVNNNISAVCHLQYGDRLTKFICCQNNIDSLDFLASLPNLECLILKGCGLVDITAISSLVKLKHLVLDGNKIKDLTPLLCMHALEWLDIRGNEVIDCEPLKKADLPRLCHLAIDLNPIKDLRPLSKYTGLEYFTCYNEVFEYDCNGQQYIRG